MATSKNGRTRGSQPAKPSRRVTEKVEHVVAADRGMTIREEFAALLAGHIWRDVPNGTEVVQAVDITVQHTLMLTDALLDALAKEPKP